MSNPPANIVVPIKLEALVIDPTIAQRAQPTLDEDGFRRPADGKWTPKGSDWESAIQNLTPPDSPPFFGAALTDGVMQLQEGNPYLPQADDSGIYLHWVLPDGLRHGYKQADQQGLHFPPLPHAWLVVRILQPGRPDRSEEARCRAWLIETDKQSDTGGSQVLGPKHDSDGSYLSSYTVGVVSDFPGGEAVGEKSPTPISAIGSEFTGSVTFSAMAADNRNVLSFHDNLSDLRDGPLEGVVFSYIVLGWYRSDTPDDEPLAFVRRHLAAEALAHGEKTAVLQALAWQLDDIVLPAAVGPERDDVTTEKDAYATAAAALPDDLLQRRVLFHGVLAHINYFDGETYLGPLLGYPGAPPAHAASRSVRPTVNVGIGNTTADALVALVAGNDATAEEAAMWKALEAVIYRQPRSLLENWKETPREQKIHKSWFTPLNGGLRWRIRAQERDPGTLHIHDGNDEVVHTPPPAVLEPLYERLEQLNELQSEANAVAREISSLQHAFYGRWWLLVQSSLTDGAKKDTFESQLAGIEEKITSQRQKLNGESSLLQQIEAVRAQLAADLGQSGLQLLKENAARFYQPADPVIVIQHAGNLAKYDFPSPLLCRSTIDPITAITLQAADFSQQVSTETMADNLSDILDALQSLPAGQMLARLLLEGNMVGQALFALASGLQPEGGLAHDEAAWQAWIDRLNKTMSALRGNTPEEAADVPNVHLEMEPPASDATLFSRLGTLWLHQPWQPLFLDWQITWFPDPSVNDGHFFNDWHFDPGSHDYKPAAAGEPNKGVPLRGRSLMAPQMGRVFSDPIEELLAMLAGEPTYDRDVEAVLKQYAGRWEAPLRELLNCDLLGQALTGLHETLLGRDVTALQIRPIPEYPWLPDLATAGFGSRLFNDSAVVDRGILRPVSVSEGSPFMKGPNWTPPEIADQLRQQLPFDLLKSGSFQVEALWIIDDFGQWFDVLGGSSEGHANPLQISPHNRWPGDDARRRVAQPPRLLQPARLHFSLVDGAFQQEAGGHSDTTPVRGWLFHNFLDQALTLCDSVGRTLGELQLTFNSQGSGVRWQCLEKGKPPEAPLEAVIADPTLLAFAQALYERSSNSQVKLLSLLALIDNMLADIRPETGATTPNIFGRPLALVNARLGLELFGQAWDDPQDEDSSAQVRETLDQLSLPIELGQAASMNDGLIGYFKRGRRGEMGLDQIVAARRLPDFDRYSGYLLDAAYDKDAVRVGFGRDNWQALTLLLDPQGIVHASSGLLPAGRLALPKMYLDRARDNFQLSFGVGPLLLHEPAAADAAVTLPIGWQGQWEFQGPDPNSPPHKVLPPTHLPDYETTVTAVEGRLLLVRDETSTQGE